MRKHVNSYDRNPGLLRDNLRDYLNEDELDKYRHLKTIRDSKRLQAMLPAWIKAHQRARSVPKQFVFIPNQPPVYPAWTYYRRPCR